MTRAGLALSAAAALLGGCASILKGTSSDVTVDSTPPGADIYVNAHRVGRTPMVVSLQSDRQHHVQLHLDGYQSQTLAFRPSLGAGWVVLDSVASLFTAFIPISVDAATGAWNSLDPADVHAVLEPEPPTPVAWGVYDAGGYRVTAPPGPGWALKGDWRERNILFGRRQPLAAILVGVSPALGPEGMDDEDELAGAYFVGRAERDVILTLPTGLRAVASGERGLELTGGRRLLWAVYTVLPGPPGGPGLESVAYVWFPPDFATTGWFFFVVCTREAAPSTAAADREACLGVARSLTPSAAPPPGR